MKTLIFSLVFVVSTALANTDYQCAEGKYSALELNYRDGEYHSTLITVNTKERVLSIFIPNPDESSDTPNPSKLLANCELDVLLMDVETCKDAIDPKGNTEAFKVIADRAVADPMYGSCLIALGENFFKN